MVGHKLVDHDQVMSYLRKLDTQGTLRMAYFNGTEGNFSDGQYWICMPLELARLLARRHVPHARVGRV
jgi:hypothetical protein